MSAKPPYGRTRGRSFFPADQYDGETYYDRPAVKSSYYGWKIVFYFFIGGLAGSAQILATIAELFGHRRQAGIVGKGRTLALVGAILSPIFLIADLHVPQRWYNMLRIFRKTSPMSLGVYILSGFGLFSGLTAFFNVLGRSSKFFHKLERIVQVPGAVAGMGMSIYTGVLLSATSTPLWAALPKRLPALFGLSAASTATSALSLADKRARERLDMLALFLGAVELGLTMEIDNKLKQQALEGALYDNRWGTVHRYGVLGVGLVSPIVCRVLDWVFGYRWPLLSKLASVGTLIGGLLMRAVFVFAGNESARRPRDTFRLAQLEDVDDH